MNRQDYQLRYEKYLGRVEEWIARSLPEGDQYDALLAEAMRYSMTSGGKRVRPVLLLAAAKLFSADPDLAGPFAAALEMIHTHSLIHDDLPAIDDDAMRRGKPSTHVVYGEAQAILAGDALLNLAYETALAAFSHCLDEEAMRRVSAALCVLAKKTGIGGMLGGQGVDVQNDGRAGKRPDKETLRYIYEKKTAALIEAPLVIAAILGGATEAQIETAEAAGRAIGIAFQIRDDILDVSGDAAKLGKATGSDAKLDKVNYVTLHGMEKALQKAQKETEQALFLLSELPGDTAFLDTMVRLLLSREQ